MKIYLDICCLKRPFDDQRQTRVHLESEAVLATMAMSPAQVEFVHTLAHDLENEQNPNASRAAKVQSWLDGFPIQAIDKGTTENRVTELMRSGLKNFDAFHLASAEGTSADVLATCDDRFKSAVGRLNPPTRVRVLNPIDLMREFLP